MFLYLGTRRLLNLPSSLLAALVDLVTRRVTTRGESRNSLPRNCDGGEGISS